MSQRYPPINWALLVLISLHVSTLRQGPLQVILHFLYSNLSYSKSLTQLEREKKRHKFSHLSRRDWDTNVCRLKKSPITITAMRPKTRVMTWRSEKMVDPNNAKERKICPVFVNDFWRKLVGWKGFYSVFQGFSKAKSANGGSILSSSQFLSLPQLPQKIKLASKVVKVNSKIIISLPKI
jgi:hypothetical protein